MTGKIYEKVEGMKVRWKGKTEFLMLTHDKVYDVISIERGWYRIMDESDDDYLYPPEYFEIVERQPITTDLKSLVGKMVVLLNGNSKSFKGKFSKYIVSPDDHERISSIIIQQPVQADGTIAEETMTVKVEDIANIEEVTWKTRKIKK